ncbi:MAG: VOC family protein [Patescibacteria group bacterium]
MIKIKEVAFFIYAVTDVPRARKFYEDVLGLKPSDEFPVTADSKWIEYNIGPSTITIGSSPDWKPSEDGTSAALELENFDEAVVELKEKGIGFKLEPQDFPTCKMAVIYDPDKNIIILHQRKAR